MTLATPEQIDKARPDPQTESLHGKAPADAQREYVRQQREEKTPAEQEPRKAEVGSRKPALGEVEGPEATTPTPAATPTPTPTAAAPTPTAPVPPTSGGDEMRIQARGGVLPDVPDEPMGVVREQLQVDLRGGSKAVIDIEGPSAEYLRGIRSAIEQIAAVCPSLPAAFVVDDTQFPASMNAFMRYDEVRRIVIINPRFSWRKLQAFMALQRKTRWYATDHPHHVAWSEIAHYLHHDAIGDARLYALMRHGEFTTTSQRAMIARGLGTYAASHSLDFVAEYFAAKAAGKRLTSVSAGRLTRLYESLGGP